MYSYPARQMCLYEIVLVERFVLALLKVKIIIIIIISSDDQATSGINLVGSEF